jgi:uroporphyrinogen decarboxylase
MDVLRGEAVFPPPIWMMRQAGRYLPEYREVREKAGSFLDLCYSPDFAVEVTLQPIRRFGFDAAILFSDILVVPHALGRKLWFEEGAGPRMEPISSDDIPRLDGELFHVNLAPVYEAVGRIRRELADEVTLIGFCGAPWTVATYMIAGRGTPDQAPARLLAYREPETMRRLLDLLARHSADYLVRQIEAGADAVQIFDSWAGVLDEDLFEMCCMAPVKRIVSYVRERYPDVPIIGFPKGAGMSYGSYRGKTGVSALGLDWTYPLNRAKSLQGEGAVQGNLDPLRLLAGGKALSEGVDRIVRAFAGGPHIFNLGHGILPETPLENVGAMVDQVRRTEL